MPVLNAVKAGQRVCLIGSERLKGGRSFILGMGSNTCVEPAKVHESSTAGLISCYSTYVVHLVRASDAKDPVSPSQRNQQLSSRIFSLSTRGLC